jgi:hypothetical protein
MLKAYLRRFCATFGGEPVHWLRSVGANIGFVL